MAEETKAGRFYVLLRCVGWVVSECELHRYPGIGWRPRRTDDGFRFETGAGKTRSAAVLKFQIEHPEEELYEWAYDLALAPCPTREDAVRLLKRVS